MAKESSIQWTDATWNIAVGCTKVDADCKNCYMYRDSFDSSRYNPLTVRRTTTVFNFPLKYKKTESDVWPGKPLIFTSSLTDVFHQDIDSYRGEMWDIIRRCPHLIFQILTKRPERITDHLPDDWEDGWDNVWLGTSMGTEESHQRLYDLLKVKCKTRFLSLEPLYGEIDFYSVSNKWPSPGHPWRNEPILYGIDWVILGGESGNENGKYTYRPCKVHWLNKLVDQCESVGVPVFVKQLGTYLAKGHKLSDRHGGNIKEFPLNLQKRQFPLIKIPKFNIDRPDFYRMDKPEFTARTRARLSRIAGLGMEEVMTAEFGVPRVVTGLYIELVWNASDEEFNSYMIWAESVIQQNKLNRRPSSPNGREGYYDEFPDALGQSL